MQQGSFQSPRENNTQTQANSVTFQYPQAYNTQPRMNTGQFQQSPYGYPDIPPPPPPPKQRHMVLVVVLIIASGLIVALGGMLFAVMRVGTEPRSTQATPTPTVATTTTATPVLVTAQSIIKDFQSQGLSTDHLSYGTTLSQWTGYPKSPSSFFSVIEEQSSATFIDPSLCGGGACDAGGVWLGVYNSISDAHVEYGHFLVWSGQQIQPSGPPADEVTTLVGRCILYGELSTSEYGAILRNDCAKG